MTYFTYGPDDYVLATDKAQEMADSTDMTWWVVQKVREDKPSEVLSYKAMSETDGRTYVNSGDTCSLVETFDPSGEDPEPKEHDPGPEVDDEGGMSEYRNGPPADPWDDR